MPAEIPEAGLGTCSCMCSIPTSRVRRLNLLPCIPNSEHRRVLTTRTLDSKNGPFVRALRRLRCRSRLHSYFSALASLVLERLHEHALDDDNRKTENLKKPIWLQMGFFICTRLHGSTAIR